MLVNIGQNIWINPDKLLMMRGCKDGTKLFFESAPSTVTVPVSTDSIIDSFSKNLNIIEPKSEIGKDIDFPN